MGVPNIFNYLGRHKTRILHNSFFTIFLFSFVPLRRDETKQINVNKGDLTYLSHLRNFSLVSLLSDKQGMTHVLQSHITKTKRQSLLLDDIILVADSADELISTLDKTLHALQTAGFRVSLQKVSLFKKRLKILGVIVTSAGIQSDPAKTAAINNFPAPQTKTEVQRFLGAVNYHSDFCRNHAKLAEPLLKYVGSEVNKRFNLDPEAMEAFSKLKALVCKNVMLNFIDPNRPIYLETDASFTGYAGFAYQISTYTKDDIEELEKKHEEQSAKSIPELNEELNAIIRAYVNQDPVPPYNPNMDPPMEEVIKNNNPNINIETKDRITKDKVYLTEVNFFISKKFTSDQIRCWSSLMKELTAILISVEKRCDLLALAKFTIVITDCAASMYLFDQSHSNSIMSRYMARLASYTFRILVRHKPGKYMKVADNLSRVWTSEAAPDKTGKVSHLQGILVKVPFQPGAIISPADIIEQLECATSPLVRSSCDPLITKATQTPSAESGPHVIEDLEATPPDLPSTLGIHKIMIQASTNTGTRQGVPNPTPRPEINDRKNITIFSIKMALNEEINLALNPENYILKQMEELSELHQQLVVGTAPPNYKLSQGLILIKHNKRWVRYTPRSLQNFIILRLHLLGHYASDKLTRIILTTDYWPGLHTDVKDFTQKCLSCLFLRGPKGPRESLGVPMSSKNCSVFQIDAVSGLPKAENRNFFVSVIDTFSRLCITFPLTNDKSAEIARNLEDKVFSIIGPCRYLVTDGARNMAASSNIKELCAQYNIITKIRTPYSSRSLGMCERVHRSILEGIRSITDSYETNWVRALPLATLAYNSMPHSGLGGYSPYQVFFGRHSPLTDPERPPNTPPANYAESYREHQKQIRSARRAVAKVDKTYKAKMRNKFGGIQKFFVPGQFVLSENKTPCVNEKRKLRNRYYGPFVIHQVLNKAVIAESILTGRLTYLNKDLMRIIPEKSVEKYKNLPPLAKLKMGGGHSYEDWLTMYTEGTLTAELNRSLNDPAYGEEGPLQSFPENFAGDPFEPTEEAEENQPQEEDPSSDEADDPEVPNAPPDDSQPLPGKQVRFSDNLPERQVHFEDDPPSRRSSRTIKAPNRLDL